MFGDGVICSSNYCRKKYSRGFFQAEGKAENDFFHSRVDKAIAVCPVSRPSVNIFPKSNYFTDRMALRYADPVNNVFRFEFYAISNASIISVVNNNFNFRNYTYNSNGTQSINLTWPGSLPVGLYPITFNFTDGCGMQSRTVKCYIEEKIIGTTLRVCTFSYIYKWKYTAIYPRKMGLI